MTDTTDQTTSDIGIDELLEVLSNRRRRYLWRFLREHSGPVTLSEASKQIAAWEQDSPIEEITYDDRKSVYTALYQHHAPLLAEHGLITFDKEECMLQSVLSVGQQYTVQTEVNPNELGQRVAGSGLVAIGVVNVLWVFDIGPYEGLAPVTLGSSLFMTVFVVGLVYLTLITRSHQIEVLEVLSDIDSVD